MVTIHWGRLCCWKMLKYFEKKKTCREPIWAISGCCIDIQLCGGNKASQVLPSSRWLQMGSKRNRKRQTKKSKNHEAWDLVQEKNSRETEKRERERDSSECCNHFSIDLWTPLYTHELSEQDPQNFFHKLLFTWVLLWKASAILGSKRKQKKSQGNRFILHAHWHWLWCVNKQEVVHVAPTSSPTKFRLCLPSNGRHGSKFCHQLRKPASQETW